MSTIAYIGLGSNIDDPGRHIQVAFEDLANLDETILLKTSNLYESIPYGLKDQPNFVNAVASVKTNLSAFDLLKQLLLIENKHNRIRGRQKNGPRTLDLDLVLYGDEVLITEELIIPHPRMFRRAFVLVPLMEVSGDILLPRDKAPGKHVSEYLAACDEGSVWSFESSEVICSA